VRQVPARGGYNQRTCVGRALGRAQPLSESRYLVGTLLELTDHSQVDTAAIRRSQSALEEEHDLVTNARERNPIRSESAGAKARSVGWVV